MDLQLISSILQSLILEHDRVSLPGLGSFMAEIAPSPILDGGQLLEPPFRKIFFRESESWNDSLLERAYAERLGVDFEEAVEEIKTYLTKVKELLEREKSYLFPNFGTLRATKENDFFFVVDEEFVTYKEGYGLKPISQRKLQKPGAIEEIKESSKLPDETSSKDKVGDKKVRRVTPVALLIILLLLLLIVISLFLFKEQLQPLWKWLLYSREERQLLEQFMR